MVGTQVFCGSPFPSRGGVARSAGVVLVARSAGVVPVARSAGVVPVARSAGVVPLEIFIQR